MSSLLGNHTRWDSSIRAACAAAAAACVAGDAAGRRGGGRGGGTAGLAVAGRRGVRAVSGMRGVEGRAAAPSTDAEGR